MENHLIVIFPVNLTEISLVTVLENVPAIFRVIVGERLTSW